MNRAFLVFIGYYIIKHNCVVLHDIVHMCLLLSAAASVLHVTPSVIISIIQHAYLCFHVAKWAKEDKSTRGNQSKYNSKHLKYNVLTYC